MPALDTAACDVLDQVVSDDMLDVFAIIYSLVSGCVRAVVVQSAVLNGYVVGAVP